MTVRRMTIGDTDAVAAIETEAFPHNAWPADYFHQELTGRPFARWLAAEENGELIGYAGVWIVLDEGDVTKIAVRNDKRGSGYGEALMRALMQYASNLGVSVLTLEVRVSNAPARGLYTKLGFTEVGMRRHYYENGEDACLMVCDRMPPADPDFTEPETVTE